MKEKIKFFFKKRKKEAYLIGIGILITIIFISLIIILTKEKEVNDHFILLKLEEASELTTSKITFTGFHKYKDDGIKIINRSDFLMVYEATARIGIDMKEVEVNSNKITKTVYIEIPKATILDIKVDSNDIKYYDQGFSLFNTNSKDDNNKAVVEAEKKAIKEFSKSGVLEMANNQSETLIKGLIQDAIPKGYEIKVTIKD